MSFTFILNVFKFAAFCSELFSVSAGIMNSTQPNRCQRCEMHMCPGIVYCPECVRIENNDRANERRAQAMAAQRKGRGKKGKAMFMYGPPLGGPHSSPYMRGKGKGKGKGKEEPMVDPTVEPILDPSGDEDSTESGSLAPGSGFAEEIEDDEPIEPVSSRRRFADPHCP